MYIMYICSSTCTMLINYSILYIYRLLSLLLLLLLLLFTFTYVSIWCVEWKKSKSEMTFVESAIQLAKKSRADEIIPDGMEPPAIADSHWRSVARHIPTFTKCLANQRMLICIRNRGRCRGHRVRRVENTNKIITATQSVGRFLDPFLWPRLKRSSSNQMGMFQNSVPPYHNLPQYH